MHVCVQYENNPANSFRDIAQKRNLSPPINLSQQWRKVEGQ